MLFYLNYTTLQILAQRNVLSYLKEDIRLKRQPFIEKKNSEKTPLLAEMLWSFLRTERKRFLVTVRNFCSYRVTPLQLLWQCCLSPGWRGWGLDESPPLSPVLPQGAGWKES